MSTKISGFGSISTGAFVLSALLQTAVDAVVDESAQGQPARVSGRARACDLADLQLLLASEDTGSPMILARSGADWNTASAFIPEATQDLATTADGGTFYFFIAKLPPRFQVKAQGSGAGTLELWIDVLGSNRHN